MQRFHAIEFEDFSWFPKALRNFMTDFYHSQMIQFNLYYPAVEHIAKLVESTGISNTIDLCSGGTGPNALIQKQLKDEYQQEVHITLTDKFPNLPAFEKIREVNPQHIDFQQQSIDATDVPDQLKGIRTMFSCFHHFRPEQAKNILQDAVNKQAPIAIFELANRSIPAHLHTLLGTPLGITFTTPFLKPFNIPRLLFTYLIPIIPLAIIWDGIASNLRQYDTDEMKTMIESLHNHESFTWEMGYKKNKIPGGKVCYLIGKPKAAL